MGMTKTARAIRLSEDALRPYIAHERTRHWLTGPGLPADGELFAFDELRSGRLRTVADSVAEPDGRLAARLGGLLVVGEVRVAGEGTGELVLLDGESGAVFSTFLMHDRPDLMECIPLAPSLAALVRCVEASEELRDTRGQFAAYAGQYGPKAVAEAAAQLRAVFRGTQGAELAELSPVWHIAALVRPLARIAGPGDGLRLDLPERLLDEEFGRGGVMRFEDVDFPRALTHQPTRRFLRETGLPEDGIQFLLDTDVPLPTLVEYHADEEDGTAAALLPAQAARLIRLGYLIEETDLVVDGENGAVYAWSVTEATLRPLNADVSTLAFTLWLLHREKTADAAVDNRLTRDAYQVLAATMTETLTAVDPVACTPSGTDDGWRYWPEAFRDEAGGVL